MICILLGLLVVGDWFFTNRENIMFAINYEQDTMMMKEIEVNEKTYSD